MSPNQGIVEYFLKWKGYDDDENCWVPMEDISPDLIKKFEQEGGSEDSSYEEESEVRSFHEYKFQ